jgi:hypothetical protein
MQKIKYLPNVRLLDMKGNVIEPETIVTDLDFLLERTYDQGIAGKRTGYAQIKFTEALRLSLTSQAQNAKERGYWELEDAYFEAFKSYFADAPLGQAVMHNLAEHIKRFFE